MKLRKIKSAQEEIVGFALIIILVAVIAVVFLGIAMRKKTEIRDSLKINDFLQSSLKTTTECAINYETNYLSVGDLIRSCLDKGRCENGKQACATLEETLTKLADDGWPVGEEYPYSSYKLWIEEQERIIINIEKGECKGSKIGSKVPIYYFEGDVNMRLELCENPD